MHHKQIFRSQLFSVLNEVAGVVVLTGNSVIYIIFCHSISNETRWYWGLIFISIFHYICHSLCWEYKKRANVIADSPGNSMALD